MANEYLKRTHTSFGNYKVATFSLWMKGQEIGLTQQKPIYFYDGTTLFQVLFERSTGTNPGSLIVYSSSTDLRFGGAYRDVSSWMNLTVSVDTTKLEQDRITVYLNGSKLDLVGSQTSNTPNYPAENAKLFSSVQTINALTGQGSYQIFDYFYVDGQALTPDVFGFYKDGDGYISVGSTQATDFKPGQWMPHSPSKIKKDVNRRGGFGVNGFYLPMNDSSNPGADFHCDPNSIIKLKGEDLPQPRNGAPTTTDAYVSQLRPETGTLGFDGCLKLDGNQGLSIADTAALDLGTGDFTIEGFYYLKDEGTYHSLFDFRGSGGDGLYPALFKDQTENKLYFYENSGVEIDDISMRHNEWMHVAICRNSGVTRAFVDGKLSGSFSDSNNYISRDLYIGQSLSNSNDLFGFVSNFRIVKGTGLYTTNFTPPTEPLTNVTNTILLCANSTTSATASTVTPSTITAIGSPIATRNELTGSIVLAVSGASTTTGANLVTNGHFDTNTTGWTSQDATLSVDNGRIKVLTTNTNYGSALQTVTGLTVGQRYTFQVDMFYGDAALVTAISGASPSINSGWQSADFVWRASFTATTTSLVIDFQMASIANKYGLWDNVVLKQEDAPRDYSADIKGSGTNKTPTVSGNSGIGYELGGYYASAYTSSSQNDYLEFPGTSGDFNVGTGDFTIETWLNPDSTQPTNARIFGQTANAAGKWDVYIGSTAASNRINMMGGSVNLTGGNGSAYGNLVGDQWNHFCLERYNGQLTTYMNGVAVYTQSYTSSIGDSTNPFRVGQIGSTVYGGIGYGFSGDIQDFRFYKGVAKYKGGFDVPKPYTPVGIEAFRTTTDTCKNNFATWNPLLGPQTCALADGNLTVTSSGGHRGTRSTIGVTSGKWYWEYRVGSVAVNSYVGVSNRMSADGLSGGSDYMFHGTSGNNYADPSGSFSVTNAAFTTGMIIGCAFDYDAGTLNIYKDGTLAIQVTGGSFGGLSYHAHSSFNAAVSDGWEGNFGQNPTFSGLVTAGTNADDSGKGLFKYAPPTGFLALCEDNLPTPAIADPGDYMRTVLYTGSGSPRNVNGLGFKPDFVWIKGRTGSSYNHILNDSVRGPRKTLFTNNTLAEYTDRGVSSFDDDGFSLIGGSGSDENATDVPYVAWCWKAGGAAVSNSDGSITAQVSANQTAGFSIATYSGGSGTVGHGLGKKPSLIIEKKRGTTSDWLVTTDVIDGSMDYLRLNTTAAAASAVISAPTSTVFTPNIGASTVVAYCWAEIEGYSKIGSYAGNGNVDGTFVYCGFKPAWLLVKRTDLGSSSYNWWIVDSSRSPVNGSTLSLYANLINAEISIDGWDFLSNGFKARNSAPNRNSSSGTYIFMAFAESPFQTANAK